MLFIDGIEITAKVQSEHIAKFEADLEKEGLKFPLKFQLAAEPPYKWWDEVNKKTRYVPVKGIPSSYTKFDRQGNATHVRYALTHIKNDKNHDIFTPSNIEFENGHPIVCTKKDTDLAYVLFYHTWRRESNEYNKGEDTKQSCFLVENKRKEAAATNEEGQLIARAYEILYKDLAREPERKKDIAKAMGHAGVDILSDNEVTAILSKEVQKNPSNFIYYTEGAHTVVKARVRHAIDNGIVTYENSTRTWFWLIQSTGMKGDAIYQVPPTQNSNEALCDYFLSNSKPFDMLAIAVEREKKSPKEVEYAEHTLTLVEKSDVSDKTSANKPLAEPLLPNRKALQKQAKELGIKSWHVKSNENLIKEIQEAEVAA